MSTSDIDNQPISISNVPSDSDQQNISTDNQTNSTESSTVDQQEVETKKPYQRPKNYRHRGISQDQVDLLEQQRRFLMEDIKDLRKQKRYLEADTIRQQEVIDKSMADFHELVKNKQPILTKLGMLSMQDKSLDKREEKLKDRENYLDGKHLEVQQKFEVLKEQKARAIAVRDAQSSSYYKPSEAEEKFFLEKRGDFLDSYEEYGNINKAAKACEIRPSLIAYYKKKFPEFAGDMQIAYDVFRDKLDGELIDRAINGQEKPSFYKGEQVDTYVEKNDGLLIAAAKAHIPEKFDRGKLDRIEGATQNNVVVNMISYNDVKPEEFGAIADVGVVKFVGEHGDMKRITADKFSQHEDATNPAGVIIDVEVDEEESRSVVFKDEEE